jgi:hypothetical protein
MLDDSLHESIRFVIDCVCVCVCMCVSMVILLHHHAAAQPAADHPSSVSRLNPPGRLLSRYTCSNALSFFAPYPSTTDTSLLVHTQRAHVEGSGGGLVSNLHFTFYLSGLEGEWGEGSGRLAGRKRMPCSSSSSSSSTDPQALTASGGVRRQAGGAGKAMDYLCNRRIKLVLTCLLETVEQVAGSIKSDSFMGVFSFFLFRLV